jgi:hypothetical protein
MGHGLPRKKTVKRMPEPNKSKTGYASFLTREQRLIAGRSLRDDVSRERRGRSVRTVTRRDPSDLRTSSSNEAGSSGAGSSRCRIGARCCRREGRDLAVQERAACAVSCSSEWSTDTLPLLLAPMIS